MASSSSSVSGLVSGMDTATIISQLMQIEAQPQAALQRRVSTEQKAVSSLQTVNAKLANVATKAGTLSSLVAWSPVKATSSNSGVTVTTSTGAAPASLTLAVGQLATATVVDYGTHALTQQVAGGATTVTLTLAGGAARTVDTGDGTLKGLVDALNGGNFGVRATLVKQTDGSYRVQVSSTKTGPSSGFSLTDASGGPLAIDGPATVTTPGQVARISVGPDTVESDTNTFADLMPGVSVTLGSGASGSATIGITRDSQALADQITSLVSAANAALGDIDSLTAYNSSTKTAGPLAGDATLRSARDQILSAVTKGFNGSSFAAAGIQVDRTGNLTFDAAKFKTAYEADPAGTAAKFAGTASYVGTGTIAMTGSTWRTAPGSYAVDQAAGTINGTPATVSGNLLSGATNTAVEGLTLSATAGATGTVTYQQGFAASLEALAQRLSNSTNGTVTNAITGRNASIKSMNDNIAAWDVRLESRKAALQRQYSSLEVSLGKLQDQASWLSGQIKSLPSSS